MRTGRGVYLLGLLIYLCLAGCVVGPGDGKRPAILVPPVEELEQPFAKVAVLDGRSKMLPEARREYVTLHGKRYEVRRPWQGHRVDLGLSSEGKNLVVLPYEFTYPKAQIYVTAATAEALTRMVSAARNDGVILQVDSGYRSLLYQRSIYLRQLQAGRDFYDIAKGVAPPGYSEHMTGTAVDLVPSDWTFHGSEAEKWLGQNARKYDFVLSYRQNDKNGFLWEPWHWRYAGRAKD
ncbi:MAG: M15 family metallopeptidase [Desulfobulbaceae bacterium]|nr:M15 family metallopeptidase [Desulfobulbaceae bacterium]HIJ78221.1 M15 family metallopeptidase [Deltaproteobacteria bacterium]